jgi:alkylation response protein AidB-like acyl-CoA dehydrogenase
MQHEIVAEFDATLTAAERALLEHARQFSAEHVAPHAAAWDREHRFPLETLRLACAQGFAGVELDPAWGGQGLSFSAKLRLAEELARDDFGFAFSLVNHANATARVAAADRALAARLVPPMLAGESIGCAGYTEPDHGSDLAHLQTTAERVADGWKLHGTKSWTTNAAVAGVIIALAQTKSAGDPAGIASFVVEADHAGVERLPPCELQGCHSIGAGGFRFVDYHAPAAALLDPPGAAFKRSLAGINGARAYVAAMCAGMLDRAIQVAVQYTSARQAFGQRVYEFQGVRWSLVDAACDLAALRLAAYRAARLIDAGLPAEESSAVAKKLAGERTLSHLAACVQSLGANGLRSDFPLMRHLVACKTACLTDGTTEMMNERLGKLLARQHAQG